MLRKLEDISYSVFLTASARSIAAYIQIFNSVKRQKMNLPAASDEESCKCYRIDEVRSVRKLVPVG